LARLETRKRARHEAALKQGRDSADPSSNVSIKSCSPETLVERARALSKQIRNLEKSRQGYKSRVAILEAKLNAQPDKILFANWMNNSSAGAEICRAIVLARKELDPSYDEERAYQDFEEIDELADDILKQIKDHAAAASQGPKAAPPPQTAQSIPKRGP
jgi:hypothetical protein